MKNKVFEKYSSRVKYVTKGKVAGREDAGDEPAGRSGLDVVDYFLLVADDLWDCLDIAVQSSQLGVEACRGLQVPVLW